MPDTLTRRWAVILAGGSGTRLQSVTRRLSGEGRPKQFCTLFGNTTLLGHTEARVASVVPPDRTAYVVVKAHEQFYNQELMGVTPHRIFVQPFDRGTTAAIAYSLARIAAVDEGATVGFFPADHYFADERAFTRTLEGAYGLAELLRETPLLLGAQPDHAEVEYGWIEPGAAINCGGCKPTFRVNRFWEKPSAEVARRLLHGGCLWNTFVMIGRVRTFLDALKESVPAVFEAFEPLLKQSRESGAVDLVARAYDTLISGDFSKQVLSALPDRLAVLRLDNVGWSDLGTPERLMAALA